MKSPIRPAVALLAAVLPFDLSAQEVHSWEEESIVVVTASRMTEPLGQTLAPVSVITRDDIELSVAEDLLELLRLQPGIDIVRTGGPGTQNSIFMRGSNSNHVLVLINGVRVGSANTGAYAWEQLPLNQVERVEIVRGPRGSLYGSDAIGGVIQVFTRSDASPYARVTGGSYDSWELEGGLGYRGEASRLSVNAGYRSVDGYSAQNENGFSYHPDNDGLEATNLGIRGAADIGKGSLGYSLLALDNRSEFDQGHSEARQWVASLQYGGSVSPDWDYQVLGGYIDDQLFTDFEFFTTDFSSRRYELSWQNQLRLDSLGQLAFGVDYYHERGQSADPWDEKRHDTGLFASYDRHFEKLHLQLGGRYDDNSTWGGKFTGQIALGYSLGRGWQLIGSYGTAFRGPNLSEQYSPGFGGLFAGNPDLDPESSESTEFDLRWEGRGGQRFEASVYRTDIDDLIAFNGEFFQAINVASARLQGVELDYLLNLGDWMLSANVTFQDNEDLTTGAKLLRRPDSKGSITLDRQFANNSWLGMEWVYRGDRDDFGGVTLPSYQLLNLRAGWAFASDWRLELRGDNLADEHYEPAYGFDGAGRSWFLSLAWMP